MSKLKKIVCPKLSSLSVVFPAYNDQLSLPKLVKKISNILPRITKAYEIIIVNDGSTDNTAAVLENLKKFYSHIVIISHIKNIGYGGALISGFRKARKEYIFYTDSDGQYDVNELYLLIQKMNRSVDMVSGYKIHRSDPWYRKIIGASYNKLFVFLLRLPILDVDCDFRLFRRRLIQKNKLTITTGAFDLEFMIKIKRADACVVNVPVHHYPRLHGSSQMFQPAKIFASLKDIGKLLLFSK